MRVWLGLSFSVQRIREIIKSRVCSLVYSLINGKENIKGIPRDDKWGGNNISVITLELDTRVPAREAGETVDAMEKEEGDIWTTENETVSF